MKIYIDVTNLLNTAFLTGIQRVVREVVIRLIKKDRHEIMLLYYNEYYNHYIEVNRTSFYRWFGEGEGSRQELFTERIVFLDSFMPGDVFFDLDGNWSLSMKRSVLLPKLKNNGVKLVVYIYDLIPITHPQFCHGNTVNNFISYVGAYLQYADLIMASTESTLDAIRSLEDQLGLPHVPSYATWLGADFMIKKGEDEEVDQEAVQAAEAGSYVLMVGTIEPRKNHSYILKAFEKYLFAKNLNLIFAGRIGWNMDAFMDALDSHPQKDKRLFHLVNMNDASIDYLYQHAFCVAFPTYNEGFGLPMIEAFERGIPVIAADIPVLREVAGDTARYCDIKSEESFAEAVTDWLEQPDHYREQVAKVKEYKAVTWNQVSETISGILDKVETVFPYPVPEHVKQMVYLTARADDLLASLPFVEHFMPFIQELVLCCPDFMVEEMEAKYHGRLKIKYLTDSENLKGHQLPKDHAMRNFYLRCLAMGHDLLDDVFIMSDDDYRPLHPITEEVFIKDGKYIGYYCYHYNRWMGSQGHPTSFDYSMYRTRDFLEANHYSTLMYDSHQPQIIDRRVFNEALRKHPGIEEQGLSDWSIYFNYLNTCYGSQVITKPYVTLSWPGTACDWNLDVQPENYIFENYYSDLYEKARVYDGFSKVYYDGIESENIEKVVRYMNRVSRYNQARSMFYAYQADYEMRYGEYPFFAIAFNNGECKIILPEHAAICEDEFTRIPFVIYADTEEEYQISYQLISVTGNVLFERDPLTMHTEVSSIELPVRGLYGRVKLKMGIQVTYRGMEYTGYTNLVIMENQNIDK